LPLSRFFPRVVKRTRAWPRWGRYGGAALTALFLFLLRYSILDGWLPHGYPSILLFLGVLVSGSLWGRGPAALDAIASAGLIAFFLIEPVGSFAMADPRQVTGLGLFLGVSAFLIETIGTQQDAIDRFRRAEAHRQQILTEFRHRTRNDLASLVGLLRLRARVQPTPESKAALVEAAGHALALSRVHTRLVTASPGHGEEPIVQTGLFVGGLVADLSAARSADGMRAVAIICDAEAHPLATERAVQLGLILQELVFNALAAGFPTEDCRGSVWIRFVQEGPQFVLTVADDGKPMGDARGQDALTLRMLHAMAAQLRGQFSRQVGAAGRGVVAHLRFPAEAPTTLPMPSGPIRA
jgi:two-component sensor histidine kinase